MSVDDDFWLMSAKKILADISKILSDVDQKNPSRCRSKNLPDVDRKIIMTEIGKKKNILASVDQKILPKIDQKHP